MKFEKPLATIAAAAAFAVPAGELAGKAEAHPLNHNAISQRKVDACLIAAQKLLVKAKQWPGVVVFHAPTKGPNKSAVTYKCPYNPPAGNLLIEDIVNKGSYDAVFEADPYIAVDHGQTYLFAPNYEDNHYSMIKLKEGVAEGAVDFYAYKGKGVATKPMPNKFNAYYYGWHPTPGKVTGLPGAMDALWVAQHIHPDYDKRNIYKTKEIPHL